MSDVTVRRLAAVLKARPNTPEAPVTGDVGVVTDVTAGVVTVTTNSGITLPATVIGPTAPAVGDTVAVLFFGGSPLILGGSLAVQSGGGGGGVVSSGGVVVYPVSAISSWYQAHTFGYYPDTRLVDVSGEAVDIAVEYPDTSHVSITFPSPFSGTIILS